MSASVLVQETPVQGAQSQGPSIKVTLSRLEGNTHNMRVAIAVADGSILSISSPQKWDRLTSPVTVRGTGSAFEGDVGTVSVLDHLYSDIGHAKGVPANNGKTTFMATGSLQRQLPGNPGRGPGLLHLQ